MIRFKVRGNLMDKFKFIKDNFGVSDDVLELVEKAEEKVKENFKRIEKKAEINQMRVMKAFSENRVSDAHFVSTSGYGYDDLGRDTLDKVYRDIFECEDALVRHNFISGTHALSTALFGVLRTGDTLFSITGSPYDTLLDVIGVTGEEGNGSLKDFGIEYAEAELLSDSTPDYKKIKEILTSKFIKVAFIQRSKGYGWRKTYSPEEIGEIIKFVKGISPDTICIVDNCYGEFADIHEPTFYGADLCVGSLIKNPGGGLAQTGGYIAGREKLVELCSYRLTSVGIGKECGASLGLNKSMYQGFFLAPHVVAQAIKGAVLCAAVYEELGFDVDPKPNDARMDIIQSIKFNDPKKVIAFCQGIQKGAPVDSFVAPEPWDMPGYHEPVIMAAGAFVQGASIELSADAPIKPPYVAYMQGGLTYESAKFGIIMSVQVMKNQGLI